MIELLIALLLLVGNAFFVGAEFSLIAARRTVIEPMAPVSRRARAALQAMNEIPLMIAGAQLGVTICSLGLGALAEPALAHLFAAPLRQLGAAHASVELTAFVAALAVVVFAHTVIGEMVPKNLTLAGPDVAVLWLGPPMRGFCLLTKPLLAAMKWSAKQILALWGIQAQDSVKSVYTLTELANLATQARAEGLLDREEHDRIKGALALQSRSVLETMRPWAQVTNVTTDDSPALVELLAARTGRSRFPVIDRASREVVGFVHVKDMIALTGTARLAPISAGAAGLIRRLVVISSVGTLSDLLVAMRRERQHMVLVSDGQSPLGVLTLHDLLGVIQRLPT